jgi:hypothetical protein
MTRQPPQLTKDGPIISSPTSLAIHNSLCSDPCLKHTAPAAQILQGHANTFRHREFRGTTAAQSCLEASEGADHHALYGQLLLLSDKHMTGLMHGDATQATLSARQGFSHHMTTHALPCGGINAQQNQPSTNSNDDPGG